MIKYLLLFSLFFVLSVLDTSAQENGISIKVLSEEKTDALDRYPGGEKALTHYLSNNIRYPYLLVKIGMTGSVDVQFTITKDGVVKNVNIIKGFDPLADEEVIRVINRMPQWETVHAGDDGSDDTVKLAIIFSLNEDLIKRAEEMRKQGASNNSFLGSTLSSTENMPVQPVDTSHVTNVETNKSDTLLNRSPEFPGGKAALEAYLKENMKYPKRAIQMGIEGRVIYNVLVSETGEITKIWLYRGIFRDCNEEAFFLIKKMPKWIPGMRDGKPVAMEVLLPIPFELSR